MKTNELNSAIKESGVNTNFISDGYHTFGELYDHRIALWIALCRTIDNAGHIYGPEIWRSHRHDDGSEMAGWFILGLTGFNNGTQITYHLPIDKWDECDFAKILKKAPKWDGHTSSDVIERLNKL